MSTYAEELSLKAALNDEEYAKSTQKDHEVYAKECLKNWDTKNEFEVVVAQDNELFIDWDHGHVSPRFLETLEILAQRFDAESRKIVQSVSISRSGNLHTVLTLPWNISKVERVAWQAAFGSDPKREALHLLSIANDEKNPILLYQRKTAFPSEADTQQLQLTDGSK